MIKYLCKIISFVTISTTSFCQEFNRFEINDNRTYQLLDHFFKNGIDQDQYGYILEGVKPASSRIYRSLSLFPSSRSYEFAKEQFVQRLLMEEISPTLEKINQYGTEFIFKINKIQEDGNTAHEFLFIHKKKLKSTIKENTNIFRSVLSPCYESSTLIDQIINSERSLDEVLCGHDALYGIVLGYLPQNSFLGGREYAFSKISISQEHPPYERQSRLLRPKSHSSKFSISDIFGLYYLAHAGGDCRAFRTQHQRMKPSSQFKSIQEERACLLAKEQDLPSCLRESPRFVFGPYQTEDSSNPVFLKLLKEVQAQTKELSKKENLVEVVLEKILGSRPKITCEQLDIQSPLESLIQINEQKWVLILTEVLSQFEREQDRRSFLEGFYSPSDQHRASPKIMTATSSMLKGFEIALANLKKSTAYFEKIPERYKAIVPNQLYFQILQQGKGNQVAGNGEIRVHYTLKDLEGNTLSAEYNSWLRVSELFQGFRHGIQGMHEGEVREILIHPALGYGPFTTLPPCATLLLKVELLEVSKVEDAFFPAIEPIEFSLIENTSLYESIKSSIDQLPYFRGAFYAEMFEKFGRGNKKAIVPKLQKLYNIQEFESQGI